MTIKFCLTCQRMAHQDICPTCEDDGDLMSQDEITASIEKWQQRGGTIAEYFIARLQGALDKIYSLQGETIT